MRWGADQSSVHSSPLQVAAGEVLELRCEAKGGLPSPFPHWSVGGRELPGEEGREAGEEGGVTSVLLLPVSREDHGEEVQCTVAHPALPRPLVARLHLSVLFTPSVTTGRRPEGGVEEGGTVTLTCRAEANPPARYSPHCLLLSTSFSCQRYMEEDGLAGGSAEQWGRADPPWPDQGAGRGLLLPGRELPGAQ